MRGKPTRSRWNQRVTPEMAAQIAAYDNASRAVPNRKGAKNAGYMPFGKYKGEPLSVVPHEYLEWFIRSIPGYAKLKKLAKQQMAGNGYHSSEPIPSNAVFTLPSGKHKGKTLDQLTDSSLLGVRNAYNGLGGKWRHIVKLCDAEITRRLPTGR